MVSSLTHLPLPQQDAGSEWWPDGALHLRPLVASVPWAGLCSSIPCYWVIFERWFFVVAVCVHFTYLSSQVVLLKCPLLPLSLSTLSCLCRAQFMGT